MLETLLEAAKAEPAVMPPVIKPKRAKKSDNMDASSPDWGTPEWLCGFARTVMGYIDLDPASTERHNQRVQAGEFYTQEDNGLTKPWYGNVWLNPPYSRGVIDQFVDKFLYEWNVSKTETTSRARMVRQGMLLVNNATETRWFHRLLRQKPMLLLFSGRVAYVDAKDKEISGNRNAQVLFYFGNNKTRFVDVFRREGVIFDCSYGHQAVDE